MDERHPAPDSLFRPTDAVGSDSVHPDAALLPGIRLFAPGTTFNERYELRRVLGQGGYAVVYLAHDRELRRDIALKVLRADRMGPVALRRFRREAAVARDAASPRLVRVFDVGASEQAVFLTMELVDGESLRDRLARGPLAVDEAVRVVREVLEGLRLLHDLRIVHRDVKPGNILLTRDGGVKLADFGLARELQQDETRATATEALVGTVDYVSPEQALGEDVDGRTDLYAVGIVLFEALTGQLPHQGKSTLGTLLAHLRQPVPDLRRYRPDIPAWLAAFVLRLLAKERVARHQTAAAALADLDRGAGAGRLRLAGERLTSRLRTRRGIAFTVAAVLACAALLATGLAWRRHQPRFAHLAPSGDRGVAAVTRDGEVLWTLPDAPTDNVSLARLLPGEAPKVVAVLRQPEQYDPAAVRVLSVLDPETGTVEARVPLPSASAAFPGFADRYSPSLTVADLDGDGADEVLVTYLQHPYYPSFTVLWEPRIGRSRVVLAASGHHRVVGTEDLDGDGRREIVFSGIANRMGWYSAMAAVRLDPPVNVLGPETPVPEAPSPQLTVYPRAPLLWYALGPQGYPDRTRPLLVDRAARRLTVGLADGGELTVDFDGFVPGTSRLPTAERQQRRREAYGTLLDALRALNGGYAEVAATRLAVASRLVAEAGDATLAEWIARQQARCDIALGRNVPAERLLRSLLATSPSASDIAFDAGNEYHLAGRLDDAIRWYGEGLARVRIQAGRAPYEFLEGLVLALVEERRWSDALAACDRLEGSQPNALPLADIFRAFVRWKGGMELDLRKSQTWVLREGPDLQRTWFLEVQHAAGRPAAALLPEVERALGEASRRGALLSLRAALLDELGRRAEALQDARDAVAQLRAARATEPAARVDLPLAEERLRAIERAAPSGGVAEGAR